MSSYLFHVTFRGALITREVERGVRLRAVSSDEVVQDDGPLVALCRPMLGGYVWAGHFLHGCPSESETAQLLAGVAQPAGDLAAENARLREALAVSGEMLAEAHEENERLRAALAEAEAKR